MNWQRALTGADRPFAIDVAVRAEHVSDAEDVPTIGPRGEIHYGDRTAFLSERDALLASVLVFHFESELTDTELLGRVWPEGATWRTLLHSLHRLNRRLDRLGLEIVAVGDRAHALRPVRATTF